MELKIKTKLLQSLVSTVIKGSENKLNFGSGNTLVIEVQKGTLSLLCTDSVTYIKVMQQGMSASDFSVPVECDKFSKIISKLSSEDLTLKLECNKTGEISGISICSGSGVFKIPAVIDEATGELVELDCPMVVSDNPEIIHLSSVKRIIQTNKPALPTLILSPDIVCYSGYYCEDEVITSDGLSKIALTQIKLFKEPALLTSKCLDLLSLMTEETIQVHRDNNCFTFVTSNMIISTKEISQKNSFAASNCKNYLDSNLGHKCTVNKIDILNVLDRIALFIDSKKDNALINMHFKQDGIHFSTLDLTGQEMVSYTNSVNWEDLTICPDSTMLKSFILNQPGETVTFEYGGISSLKFIGDNYVQIISLSAEQVQKQVNSDLNDLDSLDESYDEIEELSANI